MLFVSLHGDPRTEYPFFLGHADEVGEGAGLGFNLNLPLPAGCTVPRWFEAVLEGGYAAQALGSNAVNVLEGFEGG